MCYCLILLIFILPVAQAAVTGELVQIRQNYCLSQLPTGNEKGKLINVLLQIPPERKMSDQIVMELHQQSI